MADLAEITDRVERDGVLVRRIVTEIHKVIVGQEHLIERLLIGLLCDGHLLLEGVPGLAKTTAVKALAATLQIRESLRRLILQFEDGENHNVGAFDSDCPICCVLDELRFLVERLNKSWCPHYIGVIEEK